MATDALVSKHLAISIHSADEISIALDQFKWKKKKKKTYMEQHLKMNKFWKKWPSSLGIS